MTKQLRVLLVCLLCLILAANGSLSVAAQNTEIVPSAVVAEENYYPDLSAAAVAVRQQMVAREPVITVTYLSDTDDNAQINTIAEEIYAHTGMPKEGDYLQFHCRKCTVDLEAEPLDDRYLITLTFTVTYYSTAEQEKEMDVAVETLLQELDVYDAEDQFKVLAIYDYICENVSYDSWSALIGDAHCHTAHAALVSKSAVCQGYVTLFYRLALELGVDARVIAGKSKNSNHGWNIVCLDGLYYNVDATWDASNAAKNQPYDYFLLPDAEMVDHTRKDKYTTQAYLESFPMATEKYNGPKGDLTGDWMTSEADVLYLLRCILYPNQFEITRPADYDSDGTVNENDALRLLKHVLFPEFIQI